MIARRRITRVAVPLISDPMAAPITRLMTAVATFWDSGAVVLNGYTTAITVASAMIQVKNICGRGAAIRSRCMIAVATSAAAAAVIAYHAVDASPHAPSWRGARTGMLNSHRHTRMPTSAISAATTAVAAPPDHSCLVSTVRPEELVRSEGVPVAGTWLRPPSSPAFAA